MALLEGLITERAAPPNRRGATYGGDEQHLSEAAVMLAFAMHLLDTDRAIDRVEIHPDGEHGKRFPIRQWLESRAFAFMTPRGTTSYGGLYSDGRRHVDVLVTPGCGDVVAVASDGTTIIAECKGGILNTRHPGQRSRLRSGLCEIVGLLMARTGEGERHVAVCPHTDVTAALALRLAPRAQRAGIEIALVSGDGGVVYIRP